jgi:CRP-like cAMP-binding protein
MRYRKLDKGTLLFSLGSHGRSCFIILRGSVDVTIPIRGDDILLARLPPGSIFGQVALIEGGTRIATCVVSKQSTLLELEREPCDRLFASRANTAYKFLAALTHGLTTALRGADRQLMRLTVQNRVTWATRFADDEPAEDVAPSIALYSGDPQLV